MEIDVSNVAWMTETPRQNRALCRHCKVQDQAEENPQRCVYKVDFSTQAR